MNILLNRMHKTRLQIIRIFALLLLFSSTANEAWAEVRYHILTLPFTVKNYNNQGNYKENIRVEALLVKSDAATIGLPEQYQSPLAKNFKYYTGWNNIEYTYLYDYTRNNSILSVKYYLYSGAGTGEIASGTEVGSYTDIYVTYDYDDTNTKEILLDGTQDYNITVGGNKFLCLNRSRNNRPANANTGALTGEDLVSLDFVVPPAGTAANQIGFNWSTDQYAGAKGVYMGLWLVGSDPYNVTLKTAYKGNGTYHKDPLLGKQYYKPYEDATIFSKIVSNNDNARASDDKMWFASEHNRRYRGTNEEDWNTTEKIDEWPGFFRQMQPTFNSVAILNHPKGNGNLVFVASKINQGNGNNPYKEWAPNAKGNYATLSNDNNNPVLYFKSLANSPVINIYKIRTYTIKIKTHGSVGPVHTFTMDMRWSDARASDKIVDHIPETLKRKYCSYKAYSDEGLTNEISTFDDAKTNITEEGGKRVIWLDYNVTESFPFETLSAGSRYVDAHWYTMRMNGKEEIKNVAYKKADSSNDFITGVTSIGNNSDLHQGENSSEAMVAFIGDPYELKIINRAASEAAGDKRYIGCQPGSANNTTLTTDKTGSDDISTWEIVYESTDMENFILRQFNTSANPMYVGWGTAGDKPVIYSTTSSRIKVIDLAELNYTYYIMRANHSIAVKATVKEYLGKSLTSWKDIPEIIRSPFLDPDNYGATVHFYATRADASAEPPTNAIAHTPYDSNREIYVRYSFDVPAKAPAEGTFNVSLNSEYIYTNGSNDNINSKSPITDDEAISNPFAWTLDYRDPYAMTIWNKEKEEYIKIASSPVDGSALNWDTNVGNATLFIAKQSGNNLGIYEVMLATGETVDAGDAPSVTTTYYNIGRNESSTTENTVRLFSNESQKTGYSVLQFHLTSTTANEVVYHLIDMAGKDLLQVTTRQSSTDSPSFPPQYRSPLVDSYYYNISTDFDYDEGDATYHLKSTATPLLNIGNHSNIYVTYDVNDLVNLKRGQLYRLKYEDGQYFNQEDGSDGINKTTAQKAVYPYVNGDGNFFIYGEEQYDIQKYAASTRTRWVWYVQSDLGETGDPYHVKIMSFQSESYPITNSSDYNSFFATYKPDNYDKVVTTLVFPGISGEAATEYMVLGSKGQYQLMTSYPISGSRYVVDSFEQYWKTYDTVKNKLLTDILDNEDKGADPNQSWIVPDKSKYRDRLTGTGEGQYGFHSYEKWAYAKRFNGYNNGYSSTSGTPETKKGWEKIEHWYQTVNMGQGYFDFVETSIDPVLILLDQHGWEIMRKPLPSSPEDPNKAAKYEAIRPYNSPMVKEYAFWATAKKRTGFHQYYQLSDRVGGEDFTSTDLTDLPPFGSANVSDKKGNLNDQYVTYIVKDEYAQSYNPDGTVALPFLIEQGTIYASTSDGNTITKNNVSDVTDMKTHILNGNIPNTEQWYVRPNANIDDEMGYGDASASHEWDADKPNGYADSKYNKLRTAVYVKETAEYKDADAAGKKALTDKYGQFSFSNGFDPYNIQIESVSVSKYMKTNATGANLVEGSMIGTYSADPAISLENNAATISPKWYDSRTLSVTNATFMAVQDAKGNMQLMPRFDHTLRMSEFGTLIEPTDANVASTYTKFYRPVLYEYRIIDNSGNEALRYQGGGDLHPQTPEWFKSPLAKDFEYYTSISGSTGSGKITESLDGVSLTNYTIYVRYSYDEDADVLGILKGNWLTMTLNEKDAVYDSGLKKASGSKPEPVNASHKDWQWKFTATPQTVPDPYAVSLYNRNASAGTSTGINGSTRFALLNYYDGDGVDPTKYTLAVAGKQSFTYDFVNGNDMTASNAATTAQESGVKSASCSYDGTKAQVVLNDDVTHTFTYKVYTNGGVNAINAEQTQDKVASNNWIPELPDDARTPLLNLEQYRYYEQDISATLAASGSLDNPISTLYGLYDDIVYAHYTSYNEDKTDYMVPNVKAIVDEHVARSSFSNDAPLGLNGTRPYNIIWYADNMMKANGTAITCETKELQSKVAFEWVFEGDDPYAIKIRNTRTGNFVHQVTATPTTTELSDTPTSFMLLNREGYEYGVFAKTGYKDVMLSGYGNTLVTDDHNEETTTDNPTKFIIFALSTNKVIYHLMIKNIGTKVIIPYKGAETNNDLNLNYVIKTSGTTQRDLVTRNGTGGVETHTEGDEYQLGVTLRSIGNDLGNKGIFSNPSNKDSIYCYDAGHVSLGDVLEVPTVFYRPNVHYDYYIEGVYASDGTGGTETDATEITAMNDKYRGVKVVKLGEESELLDKIILVNIVYSFMGGLDTNSGSDFVTNVTQNKWYTLETSDATPKLAQFTNARGLKVLDGRESHYTNDYLWSPVGDPYGFKFYNRYIYKTDAESTKVLTANIPSGATFAMDTPANNDGKDIYELLSGDAPGYFKIHPMKNKEATKYYFYNDGGTVELNTSATDFTFGLTEDLVRPYYDRAGYVGGLTPAGKTAYEEALTIEDEFQRMMALQEVVYGDDATNIVPYRPGYYRLHSSISPTGVREERYASGYTHAIELDPYGVGNETNAIPLHFYERNISERRNFEDDLKSGFTQSNATRGELPISPVANDPASIFYFSGPVPPTGHPRSTIQTQGLYVKGKQVDDDHGDATMSSSSSEVEGETKTFTIMDIGGAVFLIHDGSVPGSRKYLNYSHDYVKNISGVNTNMIYDLKFFHNSPTDDARWCLQPVQKTATAGNNEMGLTLKTNDGKDDYYYATFCAPFDVLLTNAEKDEAYIVPKSETWPASSAGILKTKKIGQYNTEANGCPDAYRGSNQFIPAGTPVIIRTSSTTGSVTLALPTTSPSTPISTLLTGKYLEQMLTHGSDYVYSFGLASKGTFTEDPSFATNGEMTSSENIPGTEIGFYKNANPNKEKSQYKNEWTLNNKYVYANKIYYRDGSSGASALTRGVDFVRVVFEAEAAATDVQGVKDYSEGMLRPGNVYNLQGRCVATEEMVKDGTWKNNLTPGVYIMSGKKIIVK